MTNEDRNRLSEIGYQVIDAKNEHVEKGWIVRVPNDDERVLIAASEGDAWDAARDHHASMTSEETQAALEPCPFCGGKAEWKDDPNICGVPFGLVVDHKPDCFLAIPMSLAVPMSEEAMLAAWNTRLTAQSGEGRAAIIEECAAVADGWNPGRKDRVTETGIATAIRELSGEGRSGAGEDEDEALLADANSWYSSVQICGALIGSTDTTCALPNAHDGVCAALNARQSGEGEREAKATLADIVVQLSAIGNVLREAHFALDDSEDLSHQDPPVHAVPLDNVMRLHRALKACERFAPKDEAWDGPGPLAAQIIEQLGHHLTRSTALQTALEDICDPIAALRRYADERGRRLDGAVAFQLANDPNHIKGIARAALRATDDAGGA